MPDDLVLPARILVFDDPPADQCLLKDWLGGFGYAVQTASTGEQVLEMACGSLPDLILLGMQMPAVDGFELCRVLKAHPATCLIPVLFLSTQCTPQWIAGAFQAGAVDYLSKPYQMEEVRARVQIHLALPALRNRLVAQNLQIQQAQTEHDQNEVVLERLERELKQATSTDPLTGLFNRSHFFLQAGLEFSKARRYQRPLSVILVDIDHFKKVNDLYGRVTGDYVLVHVVSTIRKHLRASDILARFAGEQFVALLPETDLFAALSAAERIRWQIGKELLRVGDAPIPLTISTGIADLSACAPDGGLDALLDCASQALCQAKEAGHNQTVLYQAPRPSVE